ncbi:MAG: cysteine synthase family protein, partial [Victivallaceae bacterium]
MENIYDNVTELIGHTPLVRINKLNHGQAEILVKIESRNPGGSVKDRVGLEMINRAEARGDLKPGATIIEPTSGNTGIGLALVGAVRGYKVILTMPETMSIERRKLLQAYGAQIVLTPGADGMAGAIAKADELHRNTPGSFLPGQFDNPDNPRAHVRSTGEEIWRDCDGRIHVLVCGVGTGGTLSGCGRFLKEQRREIELVAVEPEESAVLS